jgi:hypothetical protein
LRHDLDRRDHGHDEKDKQRKNENIETEHPASSPRRAGAAKPPQLQRR